MIIGILPFTLAHVVLSLVGIVAGLVVVGGFLSGRRLDGWDAVFLVTTLLANASSFGFPFVKFMPSYALGIMALLILPVVIWARYGKRLAGGWRKTYVIGSVAVLYFNVFVLVAQLFHRIPAMIALAPTQTEPPFLLTELLVLALFVVLGREAVRSFGDETTMAPAPATPREPVLAAER